MNQDVEAAILKVQEAHRVERDMVTAVIVAQTQRWEAHVAYEKAVANWISIGGYLQRLPWVYSLGALRVHQPTEQDATYYATLAEIQGIFEQEGIDLVNFGEVDLIPDHGRFYLRAGHSEDIIKVLATFAQEHGLSVDWHQLDQLIEQHEQKLSEARRARADLDVILNEKGQP